MEGASLPRATNKESESKNQVGNQPVGLPPFPERSLQPSYSLGFNLTVGTFLLIFIGFLAYQNYQLKNKLIQKPEFSQADLSPVASPSPDFVKVNASDSAATPPQTPIYEEILWGIWQDSPVMASGWSNRYHFFPSHKYIYRVSQMDCANREIGSSGRWELKDNGLVLTTINVFRLVGGRLEPASGSCGTDQQLVEVEEQKETLIEPKIQEVQIGHCATSEAPYYKCLSLDSQRYYQYSADPSYYGRQKIEEEPDF